MNNLVKLERRVVNSHRYMEFFLNGQKIGCSFRRRTSDPMEPCVEVYLDDFTNSCPNKYDPIRHGPCDLVKSVEEAEAWLIERSNMCRAVTAVRRFVDKMITLI